MTEQFAIPVSPLQHHVQTLRELDSADISVYDSSLTPIIEVLGDAAGSIKSAFGKVLKENGQIAVSKDGLLLAQVTPEKFYISVQGGEVSAESVQSQLAKSKKFLTVTNKTNGFAQLTLVGAATPDLLSKLCGLDFHANAFAANTLKISSVAKIRTMVWCHKAAHSYILMFPRSYADYFWPVLREAGSEFALSRK